MCRTAFVLALPGLLALSACQPTPRTYTSPSGFEIRESAARDILPPCPEGAYITVDVTISLLDGKTIDSTLPVPSQDLAEHAVLRDAPLSFSLRDAVPGLRELIAGMRVGQTRTATIPPDLAYGAEGRPPRIPPNSPLSYKVTLLDFHTP